MTTETGRIDLEIPRDRQATFDPQLIAKYQRRFPGFDDKIVSMYARGMSTREIGGHLRELYGIEVSPDLTQRRDGCGAAAARASARRDCQDFRVRAVIVDLKEVPDGTTQSTSHP